VTINCLQVSWEGLHKAVLRGLRSWAPTQAADEKACQAQLAELLRTIAPEARVEREYAHMGCKIDAYITHRGVFGGVDEVLIEAKLNLSSENEYKRLVGQIEMMKPKRNNIIVVLFGETKPEFSARLREMYPSTEDSVAPPYLTIIEKPLANES
jgi:hypothetical protein